MAGISDLPMLHDIDADYSPQYVKLARVLRDKIESGQYRRGDSLPAAELAGQYKVSVRVTCNALAMLAANRYLSRPGPFSSYNIIWQGDRPGPTLVHHRRRHPDLPQHLPHPGVAPRGQGERGRLPRAHARPAARPRLLAAGRRI
jgi:DNA-binding transcriptional MocR family regulator